MTVVFLPSFADSDTISVEDLDAASGVIRGYCRWHIWPVVTETLVVDGDGRNVIMLPTLRLSAVTALVETQRGAGQTPVTLNVATDLDWSAAGMIWRVDERCWTRKPRGLSVTFTHGLDDAPAEIAQLTLALAQRTSGNPSRLKRSQVGQRSEDYAQAGLLEDEMAALAPYRRLV